MIQNPKAAWLHSWTLGACLGLLSLVLWVTAFAWYFYGHQRVAEHVHNVLVRLGLREQEVAVQRRRKKHP